MRQAEKERKKIQTRIPFILDPGKKIPKKQKKEIKNFKNLFRAIFLAKTGCDRPRKRDKKFTPEFCSNTTQARKFEIKNSKKIQNFKKLILILFLSKTGWERARMRKKKIIPEFRSYSTPAKKFRKKKLKNSRN